MVFEIETRHGVIVVLVVVRPVEGVYDLRSVGIELRLGKPSGIALAVGVGSAGEVEIVRIRRRKGEAAG